jgi:Tol biopolymer transport system component
LAGYEVLVSSIDGSDVRKILQLARYESPNPTWSPGPRIAFTRRGDGQHFDLWTMNPDGTEQVRVTDGKTSALVHRWSPDGTRFLFLSDRNAVPGDVFDVYTIAADGTRLTNLTPSSTSTEINADWSPDGRLVAFSGSEEGADGMFTVDTAGRNRARLTTTVGEEHDDQVDWQPLVRSSFPNAAAFCRVHRAAVGSRLFSARYGNVKGAGAFGRCVNGRG